MLLVVAALFTAIVLATGAIWGHPIWGTWWAWDARLTSTLILFLIYCGYLLARSAITEMKKRVDYSEYGGAPLLGVKGCTIICHGRSNANAIRNAIRVAAEFSEGHVNEKIEAELEGQEPVAVS